MPETPVSEDELSRLAALEALSLLDTAPEPEFDQLTRLAADIFEVPMVGLSLVAETRQWFKSSVGLDVCETNRGISFCTYTIRDQELMVVGDARADPRFSDNPLVTDAPGIRFYAGAPLRPDGKHRIGTLCVLDTQARGFDDRDRLRLRHLADQCEALLRAREDRRALAEEHQLARIAAARYRALQEESATGVIRIDCRGVIQSVNRHALTMLGYAEDELLGCNVKVLIPAPWQAHHDDYLRSYLDGGPARIIGTGRKVEARHRDGRRLPVHLAVTRVDLGNGGEPEFIGILTDLSELLAARNAEQRERALLRSIIDASPDPIFARATNGRYIIANPASLTLAGITDEEISRFDLGALLPPDKVDTIREADASVIESGQVQRLPLSIGDQRQFELTKSPLRDSDGTVRGVVTLAHEVTDLHGAKRTVEAQSELLGVLHAGLTDYHTLISGDGLWNFLKQALRRLTDSDYALIGEVLTPDGQPSLKIHAITDLSWSDQSRKLMEQLRSGDMMLTRPGTLLGRVFSGGETVICTDLAAEDRRGGFPPGHPPLFNYVGVPITDGGEVIGMYAIANCHRKVDDELVKWLEPYTATCALLIKLYRGMEERERITEALRTAGEEQARANRAKTEFLSAMSHELRTPLNAILGFAQLLRNSRRETLSERQRGQVEQIEKSGRHLLALINEVLDLARIDAGRLSLSLEPVDLHEVLDDALATVSTIAADHRVDLDAESPTGAWMVHADRTRLRQVLINLLSNAIKYNRPGGRVAVSCELSDATLRCHVRDTGTGIPAARMGELFQPFNRLGAENGTVEGTGVGLALTRKLIEHMQGRIEAESTEGVGSCFWFELPLAEGVAIGSAHASASTRSTSIGETHRARVLYVEDNPANRRLMRDVFEELPALELICAEDGASGLRLAKTLSPRLIILDINLPDINGFVVRQLLSDEPSLSATPILALSASAMPSEIRRGLEAGFVDYMTKPFDVDQLIERIETLLQTDRANVDHDRESER